MVYLDRYTENSTGPFDVILLWKFEYSRKRQKSEFVFISIIRNNCWFFQPFEGPDIYRLQTAVSCRYEGDSEKRGASVSMQRVQRSRSDVNAISPPQGCRTAQKRAPWSGTRSCSTLLLGALSPSNTSALPKTLRWVPTRSAIPPCPQTIAETGFISFLNDEIPSLRPRSWSWSCRKRPPSPSARSPPTPDPSSGRSSTGSTSCCPDGPWCPGESPSPPRTIRRAWSSSVTSWRRSLWWVRLQLATAGSCYSHVVRKNI